MEVLLLDLVQRAILFHDRIYVGLEPLFRRVQVLYVFIHRRLRTQIRGLVPAPKGICVPPADVLTKSKLGEKQHRGAGKHVRDGSVGFLECQ
jgi:hypothetical protein